MNLPSIKTLRAIFGDRAKEARAILEMTRAELETLPAGAKRVAECYHPPKTWDVRMECLNAICDSAFGVESVQVRDERLTYLNTGDPYTPTLIYWHGRYRVACWGDIVERFDR